MTVELVEVEPGKWRVKRDPPQPARSGLRAPSVIGDTMDPTEQVDGRHYTSKAQFRRVGRELGLTEVGNEKFAPKQRSTDLRETRDQRRQSLRVAVERYKAGHRPRNRP